MEAEIGKEILKLGHFALSFSILLGQILWPDPAVYKDGACYDYIIIGSGAGSVVANRLTENENISVLLIEAGNIPTAASMIAGAFPTLQNSNEDWQYKSEKEIATQSQSEERFKIAIGKVLGGSSAIDHLVYLRGSPNDYNEWATMIGDKDWNYESILSYFKKSETVKDKQILKSDNGIYHSNKGPVVLKRQTYKKNKKFLKAFEEVGKKTNLDLNGNNPIGYSQPLFNIGKVKIQHMDEASKISALVGIEKLSNYTGFDVRQSLSQSYISPIRKRKNLHVSYKTLATKINFDENNNAVSVDIIKDGKKMTVKAAREIILCAGVFNSPQLLMLSGIGPKEHLKSFGIPVIQDLPVGQNLQDHVAVQLVHTMEDIVEVPETPKLTTVAFPIFIGAVNLNKTLPSPEYQTTNLAFTHDTPLLLLTSAQIFGYSNEISQKLQARSVFKNTLLSLVALLQPKSRGEVKLRSIDTNVSPVIKSNFYSEEKDFNDMVDYVADFIGVGNSTYFNKVKAKLIDLEFDECVGNFKSKEYIRCYIKHMSTTLYHQTSTCPMGTVLESNLKVKGVNRLRVIDASAFPKITTANPLATVVMLAEKGSDMIKKDQNDLKPLCTTKGLEADSSKDKKWWENEHLFD